MHMIHERYLERMHRRGRNGSTVRNFKKAAAAFERFCAGAGLDPATIGEREVEEWCRASREIYAPNTVRVYYKNVRAAYRYAHQDGLLPRFPFVNTEMPAVPETRPRIIPNAKLREIKGNCTSERNWKIFHLFAYTGCRLFEIQKAAWEDVEETTWGQQLTVIGKGGKLRYVPIHPALQEVLGERWEGPLVPDQHHGEVLCQTRYYAALREIGGNGFGFHDFRRTAASSLRHNGVEKDYIKDIFGWSKDDIFDKHYRHTADESLFLSIMQLYVDDPL